MPILLKLVKKSLLYKVFDRVRVYVALEKPQVVPANAAKYILHV